MQVWAHFLLMYIANLVASRSSVLLRLRSEWGIYKNQITDITDTTERLGCNQTVIVYYYLRVNEK